ncbi:MAG: TetR/AcrR family transcriptional regulator [Gammaproteobacteria bacterium]|nr:TetR/AcrR family transcriptional regulator [Gammaproteobacteria bacterium]
MVRKNSNEMRDGLLDAAETVVTRQGIANLALDAVAAEAGVSKGGLLHHFPSKDHLVQAMVQRTADYLRAAYDEACESAAEGPGRMTRGLLNSSLADCDCWSEQCRRSSSAVFAALAQNSDLIEPMREVYSELHRRVADDGLPPGVGETVAATIDGLWLYWVLGLVPVNQEMIIRVRKALEDMVARSQPAAPVKRKAGTKPRTARPSGGRRT